MLTKDTPMQVERLVRPLSAIWRFNLADYRARGASVSNAGSQLLDVQAEMKIHFGNYSDSGAPEHPV